MKQVSVELSRTDEGKARGVIRDENGHAILIAEASLAYDVAQMIGREVWVLLREFEK